MAAPPWTPGAQIPVQSSHVKVVFVLFHCSSFFPPFLIYKRKLFSRRPWKWGGGRGQGRQLAREGGCGFLPEA